jgi:subtilisin family serine protease
MEPRRLLAADLSGNDGGLAAELPEFSATLVSANESTAASSATASSATASSANTAGEFAASAAADIGKLDGSVSASGTLGWFNFVDTISFSLEREGDVDLQLGGNQRNIDLYLTDTSGRLIDSSTNWGNADESIEATLDSGQYRVWVIARSFWSTGYRLNLNAELVPEPQPVASPSNPPAPSSGVQPLADVDYFGGSREWNLNTIAAPEAWAAGYTGAGVTVAVVDTGVDLDHPDLQGNLFVNQAEIAGNGIDDDQNGFVDDVHGYDFADNDALADDVHGHGTHVAGTIAALNNGFGATGVAPDASILPIKVLGDNGAGNSFNVAAGIRYAAAMGADVINLSLGGGYSSSINAAIDYAHSLGSLVVAAAGNESAAMPSYPARFSTAFDNVISVGAHDSNDQIASFSNDVGGSSAVQIDAPGVGVFSTYVGGRYATMSGTSMAAPHVAGLAALTLAADPTLTSREVRDLLTSGVVGQISGSDAIGKASALNTVAYAAAGVTAQSNSSGSNSSSSTSNGTTGVTASSTVVAPNTSTSSSDRSGWRDQYLEPLDGDRSLRTPTSRTHESSHAANTASVASANVVDEAINDWESETESGSDPPSGQPSVEDELALILTA